MRRFLALFLLLLLPLQFSWAAVESYCEHEDRIEAVQTGQHTQHADAPAAASDASTPSDTGCDSCHCHGHFTGISSRGRAVEPHPSNARPTAALADTGGAHAPARPERPQWAPLA